jgi:hypothetical protein
MKNTKAPKVVLKIGFPIFTIIAGTLLVLKLIGVADISWLLILGVWLAPLWIIIGILLCILAIIIAIGIVAGFVFVICYAGDWCHSKFKNLKFIKPNK